MTPMDEDEGTPTSSDLIVDLDAIDLDLCHNPPFVLSVQPRNCGCMSSEKQGALAVEMMHTL